MVYNLTTASSLVHVEQSIVEDRIERIECFNNKSTKKEEHQGEREK